jgi:CRISPR-associated protein Cas1
VQLCAQGLVLMENGFTCHEGVIYFVKSKKKVTIAFDDALIQRTRELIGQMTSLADHGHMPPPLIQSPKCVR